MQHTEKYNFNIIENADTFNPDAINANTRAVEKELAALTDTHAAKIAALASAVGAGGKTARIAYGSYVGTNEYGEDHPNTLNFDFKPYFIFLSHGRSYYYLMLRGVTTPVSDTVYTPVVTWGDSWVSWYNKNGYGYQNNASNVTYYWVAIGESL